MASQYIINAGIRFNITSGSVKPAIDKLTKDLAGKSINIPVNLKFQKANIQNITQQNSAMRALTNTISALNAASIKSSSSLNTLGNRIHQLTTGIQTLGKNNNSFQKMNTQLATTNTTLSRVSNNFKTVNKEVVGFSESVGISARRFISFGIAAGILAKISYDFRNAVVAALEFDREMVRLKQVSGDSNEIIAGIGKTISKLGINFGVSSKDMSEAAITLRQAGLSARDTQKALEVLGKTTLSPTFEDLKSTTEGLIAVFNQFGGDASKLENQFSAISRVSADFAVESNDLVEAIKRTGGAFKAAGGNLNELLAMFTTVRSTTRESAESIATGMRTIIARLQDPAIARKLHDIGVEVYDLQGNFVGPYEAVNRLGNALRKLPSGNLQASQVLKDIGGLRQLSRVIPLIYNNGVTEDALRSAKNSAGTLQRDVEVSQEAILNQLSRIKEGFLDLFRVISTDSSVKTTLSYILKTVEGLGAALRELKPLVPVFLAFTTAKLATSVVRGASLAYRGFSSPRGFSNGGTVGPTLDYAEGGGISGGIPNKDSVLIKAMPGEFILNKQAAQAIGYGNLLKMNSSAYRTARIKNKYGFESQYGNFAQHLRFLQLDHRKRLHRTLGDYRLYKSPNFERQKIISHKRYLRNLINEQKLLQNGIEPSTFAINNARQIIQQRSSSNNETIPGYAEGGIVKKKNIIIPSVINTSSPNEPEFPPFRPFSPYTDAYRPTPIKKPDLPLIQGNYPTEQVSPGGIIITGNGNYRKSRGNISLPPHEPISIDTSFALHNQRKLKESITYGGKQNLQGVSARRIELANLAKQTEANIRSSSAKQLIIPDQPYNSLSLQGQSNKYLQHYKVNQYLKNSTILPTGKQPSIPTQNDYNTYSLASHDEGYDLAAAPLPNIHRPIFGPKPIESLASKRLAREKYTQDQERVAEAQAHFTGLQAPTTVRSKYSYASKGFNGQDITGSILARSTKDAEAILRSQGQFVTAIKKLDNSSSQLFPTFSKWLTGTTKNINGVQTKTGGLLGKLGSKIKGIGPAGLFAAGAVAPILSEQLLGTTTQPGHFGETGAKVGSVLSGGIAGAATGAAVGSTLGPVGTGIGAFIGALAGATGALNALSEETKELNFKKLEEGINNIKFDASKGTLGNNDRTTVSNLISKSIQAGGKEKYDTLENGMSRGFGGKSTFKVGKYEALQLIPEADKQLLSDAIKTMAMRSAQENPTQDYKSVIEKLGKFNVGKTKYSASDILGLNLKNVGEVQNFINSQKKAADLQNKLNAILGQVNNSFELTAQELEDFSHSLQSSGEQYFTRQQYSNISSSPLNGQIATTPNNVTIGNLGGKGTVAGDIHEFSRAGGGYDQSRQQLLSIIENIGKEKLGTSPNAEESLTKGIKASQLFANSNVGGNYKDQIADELQNVITNTPDISERIQRGETSQIADKVLGKFKNVKETGTQANQDLRNVYGAEQQQQINIANRNYELRQQRANNIAVSNEVLSNRTARFAQLTPDLVGQSNEKSRFVQIGKHTGVTIPRNRLQSIEERTVNAQALFSRTNFANQQAQFGAGGLNAGQIENKYNEQSNKLGDLTAKREKAVNSGANIDVVRDFDREILKTQDTMRNYATALKNLADNTTNLQAAQKQYEVAVNQFTADYESRKRDADVMAFGSTKEKFDLQQRENVTQQALSLNPIEFQALPEQIRKMVFERLSETKDQVRSVQQYDRYGRERGTLDVTGEQALQHFRQPFLNMTQTDASRRLQSNANVANNRLQNEENNKLKANDVLNNLGTRDVNKQTIQNQDNFQKYIQGINEGVLKQIEATNRFLAGSAELTKALNSFNGNLKIERNGKVEVIVNGGNFLAAAKGDLEKEIIKTVIEKFEGLIDKKIKDQKAV